MSNILIITQKVKTFSEDHEMFARKEKEIDWQLEITRWGRKFLYIFIYNRSKFPESTRRNMERSWEK